MLNSLSLKNISKTKTPGFRFWKKIYNKSNDDLDFTQIFSQFSYQGLLNRVDMTSMYARLDLLF